MTWAASWLQVDHTVLVPFASHRELAGSQVDLAAIHLDQLADPQAGGEQCVQDGKVTEP